MSNAAIRALLLKHLQGSSLNAGTEEALALFDKYVDLIEAESKMIEEWSQQDLNAPTMVAAVLEERRNMRLEYLGDTLAQAFYADQEKYEDYQLERLRISTDKNLTVEQKAAAIAEAENLLTPEQREIRKKTFAW